VDLVVVGVAVVVVIALFLVVVVVMTVAVGLVTSKAGIVAVVEVEQLFHSPPVRILVQADSDVLLRERIVPSGHRSVDEDFAVAVAFGRVVDVFAVESITLVCFSAVSVAVALVRVAAVKTAVVQVVAVETAVVATTAVA